MQIQHPTAIMIARSATAQDDVTGDGTSSSVLFVGELLKYAERYIAEGVHPRVIADGFELAKTHAVAFLDKFKVAKADPAADREHTARRGRGVPRRRTPRNRRPRAPYSRRRVSHVGGAHGAAHQAAGRGACAAGLPVRASSRRRRRRRYPPPPPSPQTHRARAAQMADQLTEIVTDAVLLVRREGEPIDLHMVERMHMLHRTDRDSRLVRGLVLDHGGRHPDMPSYLENVFVLSCNVSLEYEKTEHSATFVYTTADEREKLVSAERRFVDEKVKKILELKRAVCTPENKATMVVINQKGIDPVSLDLLAREGVLGLRRAKRRNMERLALACGGWTINSVEDMAPECLGWAGKVYEQTLGDEKYTFVEDPKHPHSCTILLRGANDFTIAQLKDAVRDGMRAVVNAIEDAGAVPGAGAFELAAADALTEFASTGVQGKAKLGVLAFAEALLVIPKTLAENSGFDVSVSARAPRADGRRAAPPPPPPHTPARPPAQHPPATRRTR